MYEAPWKDCFTESPRLARRMWRSKENDIDIKDIVNKSVANALDESGLGQGLPPLHPDTDCTHGSTSCHHPAYILSNDCLFESIHIQHS
jgi:hypothetical protein